MDEKCKCAYRANLIMPKDAPKNAFNHRELLDDSDWEFLLSRIEEARKIIESERREAEDRYNLLTEHYDTMLEARRVFRSKKRELRYRKTGRTKWNHDCAQVLTKTQTLIDQLIQDDNNSMSSLLTFEINCAKMRTSSKESDEQPSSEAFVDPRRETLQAGDSINVCYMDKPGGNICKKLRLNDGSSDSTHENNSTNNNMTDNYRKLEFSASNCSVGPLENNGGISSTSVVEDSSHQTSNVSSFRSVHGRRGIANWSLKLVEIVECQWSFRYPRFRARFQGDPIVRNVQASQLIEHGYFEELLHFVNSIKLSETAEDAKKFEHYCRWVGAFEVLSWPNLSLKETLEHIRVVEAKEKAMNRAFRQKYNNRSGS